MKRNPELTQAVLNDCLAIVGPQGCGKTTNAELLRRTFGKDHVCDDFFHERPTPKPNSLVLTFDRDSVKRFPQALDYSTAMAFVEIAQNKTSPPPESVQIKRDENGMFAHPSIPWDATPEEHDVRPLLNALGYECSVVAFEYDAPEYIADRYYEHGATDISDWQPSRPLGGGWFIGLIADQEDGPIAVWLRRREPATTTCPGCGQSRADCNTPSACARSATDYGPATAPRTV